MKYQLAKKAFWCGEIDVIFRQKTHGLIMPDEWIGVEYGDSPSQAKAKFAKDNYMDFIEVRAIRAKDHDLYYFEGKQVSLSHIENTLKLREWRRLNTEASATSPDMEVLIYSHQWGAYWRENARGYTTKKDDAGVYSMKSAWESVSHCGLEKGIEIIPLRLPV